MKKSESLVIRENVLLALGDALPLDGKSAGFIKIPYSSNTSAYGFIPVPFVVAGPSRGPRVLVMAGTYGDETECQIALARLARSLDPAKMHGQVVILPMANEPAAQAGLRNSPIDNVSLGRSYPGDVFGSPTAVIAQYIERFLMPQCDLVVDAHSGGDSLTYLPCVLTVAHNDIAEMNKRLAFALAFHAPLVLISYSFEERNSSGAAKRAGTVRTGIEISGPKTIAMTIQCVEEVLRWSGIFASDSQHIEDRLIDSEILEVHPESDYIYALSSGMFEPAIQLGASVKAGDCAGFIHDVSCPLAPPDELSFTSSGKVVCLRPPGHARRGDCLMHLATALKPETAEQIAALPRPFWGLDGTNPGKQKIRRR
ncbi:succinylglutamate desuccinylase/aspartoacylase family protein [Paraburkholderia sp.]|uniref:succinylglutamate desuccinylase/aspartoacylase domain-containing protein n=1 Tax=Paraburkholderia sp. TaxID=1926495 RepID=UPI0039E573E3